jgi:hypothetical protein
VTVPLLIGLVERVTKQLTGSHMPRLGLGGAFYKSSLSGLFGESDS